MSNKTYYQENKEEILRKSKIYREQNKEAISLRNKLKYLKNKDKIIEKVKGYYQNNRDKVLAYHKTYDKENRKKITEYQTKYTRDRRQTDIDYKLRSILSCRIRDALNGKNKSKATKELIGCDIPTLMMHLEKQFRDDMTWDNHGKFGWHIDHILPCASFDLTDPEQQKKCFHYTNLQPLWAEENLSKSDTILIS